MGVGLENTVIIVLNTWFLLLGIHHILKRIRRRMHRLENDWNRESRVYSMNSIVNGKKSRRRDIGEGKARKIRGE
jgi:hypothetical protein